MKRKNYLDELKSKEYKKSYIVICKNGETKKIESLLFKGWKNQSEIIKDFSSSGWHFNDKLFLILNKKTNKIVYPKKHSNIVFFQKGLN